MSQWLEKDLNAPNTLATPYRISGRPPQLYWEVLGAGSVVKQLSSQLAPEEHTEMLVTSLHRRRDGSVLASSSGYNINTGPLEWSELCKRGWAPLRFKTVYFLALRNTSVQAVIVPEGYKLIPVMRGNDTSFAMVRDSAVAPVCAVKGLKESDAK